ncbi:uncharacterized protein LOC114353588 [Ostrinia furnacalis]|uniref:uncharacterized protein LOC114353588 n=1 Tax=Ostrinia furnacalis TaxID=93504 RepID=UPI00103B7AAA|nr:uncharacterized protein LOC114353588 [Ostrinia furnacalis]
MWVISPEHERAPLSLHECLDSPPPKTGYRRSWFLVFLLAPLAYYLVVACIATTPVTHTNQMSEMEQEQHSFMSVPVSFNSVFLLRQECKCCREKPARVRFLTI